MKAGRCMRTDLDLIWAKSADDASPSGPGTVDGDPYSGMMAPEPLYRDSPKSKALRVLREWIADGTLAPGSELPSERSLADRLDLPRTTVNRAISDLMEEGLIRHEGGYTRTVTGQVPRTGWAAETVLILAPPIERGEPTPLGGNDQATLGALNQCRAHGWHGLVIDTRHISLEELTRLSAAGFRGVAVGPILIGSRIPRDAMVDCLQTFRTAGIPVATLDVDLRDAGFDLVMSDQEEGAYQLTRRLIAEGSRRILFQYFLGDPPAWLQARRRGYQRAIDEAGLEALPDLATPDLPGELEPLAQARSYVGFLIEHVGDRARPDALLAINDHFAVILAAAFRLMGIDPVEGIRLCGYDGNAATVHFAGLDAFTPWASVDRDMYGCGRALARVIRERLRSPQAEPQRVCVPPRLLSGR